MTEPSTEELLERAERVAKEMRQEWWTPREVSDLYRVHITTVYHWIHIGKLPAVRIRRNIYRIRRKDVEALAEKPEHPEGLKKREGK